MTDENIFLTGICISIVSSPFFYKWMAKLCENPVGFEKIFVIIHTFLCSLGEFMVICILGYLIRKFMM